MREDLTTWLSFLDQYNGVTAMPEQYWVTNDALELFTDSAGGEDMGFGIYFKGHWAHGDWPDSWKQSDILRNITFLELFPVVTAVYMWREDLKNKKVLFHIDNQAVVHIINKKSAKDTYVMKLLRRLVLLTLQFNILLKAEHIEGSLNSIADAISRSQWKRFRDLAPKADPNPIKIPAEIWKF